MAIKLEIMPLVRQVDATEMSLDEIRKDFELCVAHGGSVGIGRALCTARDQIELRPTGGEAITLIVFLASHTFFCFECYRVLPLAITSYNLVKGLLLTIYFLGAYLIGSLRLDILDHKENRVIRTEARKAVTAILEKGGTAPAPLEDSAYRYLKDLVRGDRRFRRTVKPLLKAGIDPRDCLDFDTLEANEERALEKEGIGHP